MKPEDDFSAWLTYAHSLLSDAAGACSILPELSRLITSIENTDALPTPIEKHTDDFISDLESYIISTILDFDSATTEQIEQFLKFFSCLVDFSKYGLQKSNNDIFHIATQLICRNNTNLYLCDYQKSIHYLVSQMVVTQGLHSLITESLEKRVSSFELLYDCWVVSITCSTFISDFNFWDFNSNLVESVICLAKENLRAAPTSTITTLFTQTLSNTSHFKIEDNSYVCAWMKVALLFIKSELFEKTFTGYRYVQQLLTHRNTHSGAVQYFSDPAKVSEILIDNIHQKFLSVFTSILTNLADAELIHEDEINWLFKITKNQHETDLPAFLLLHIDLVSHLSTELQCRFVSLTLDANFSSSHFQSIISAITDPKAISIVRDLLWKDVIEQHNEEHLQILSEIIDKELSNDQFEQYLNTLSSDLTNQSVTLLKPLLSHHLIEDKDFSSKLVEKATQKVIESNEKDLFTTFLADLSVNNRIPLTHLTELFSMISNVHVAALISKMLESDLIDTDFIEKFFNELDSLTENTYALLCAFIQKVNHSKTSVYTTSLPLRGEEIAWKFSLIDSPFQSKLWRQFIFYYTWNDGVTLTDGEVIRIFLEQWEKHGKCIPILKSFIDIMEANVDDLLYHLNRHNPRNYSESMMVDISGDCLPVPQRHRLSPNMRIMTLCRRIERLARLPPNSISLYKNDVLLQPIKTAHEAFGTDRQADLKAVFLPQQLRSTAIIRQRDAIPSLVIPTLPIFNYIWDELKAGNQQAKDLLDFLPNETESQLMFTTLEKSNKFDFATYLPLDMPQLFFYNLEIIDIHYNQHVRTAFRRCGGYPHLFEAVKRPELAERVLDFMKRSILGEDRENYSSLAWESIYELIKNNLDDQLLVKEATDELIDILEKPVSALPDISLLFDERDYVRENMVKLYAKVEFGIDHLLPELKQRENAELWDVIATHVDKNDDLIFSKIDIHNEHCLAALEQLLKKNLLTEAQYEDITKRLIEGHLMIDDKPRTTSVFKAAIKCLALIRLPLLYDHLDRLHMKREAYEDWSLDGDSNHVSETGYVGLQNIGLICFLNSTIQQFYANEKLRKAVIEYDGDDAFLHELKRLFARLYLSKDAWISPAAMVEKFTDWEGEPLDPMVQQDASEFVQILIDKLEGALGHDVVAPLFMGTITNKLSGEDFHTDLVEHFSTFTLPIKNVTNTDEAFKAFQKPEIMEQYRVSEEKKIDVEKRQVISNLPETLIIQLSRFDYSPATYQRYKVNSQFSFPTKLDLSEEAVEGIESHYHLKGVIIHSGTAEFGHYTSYVKYGDKWYDFNDQFVTEVTEEQVLTTGKGTSSKNAYLIFYERDDVLPLNEKPHFSEEIIKEVSDENRLNSEIRLFCSEPYFELMKSYANTEYANLSLGYFISTLPFTMHVTRANEIFEPLTKRLENEPQLCAWLLQYLKQKSVWNCLIYCPTLVVRKGVTDFLKCIDLTPKFANGLIDNLCGSISYGSCAAQGFGLLKTLLKYADPQTWVEKITTYLDEISQKDSDFFSDYDLSGALDTLAALGPLQSFGEVYLSDDFLIKLLSSKSRIGAITGLAKKFNNAHEMVIKFAHRGAVKCNFVRVYSFLIQFFGEEVFDVVKDCVFTLNNRPVTNFDFTSVMAVVFNNIQPLVPLFLSRIDDWLVPWLMDDNPSCRKAVIHAIAYLIPSKEAFSGIGNFPDHECSSMFGDMDHDLEDGPQNVRLAQFIVMKLVEHRMEAIKYLKSAPTPDCFCGLQYLELLDRLNRIAHVGYSNELRELLDGFMAQNQPFDTHVKLCYGVLVQAGYRFDYDFIWKMWPQGEWPDDVDVKQKLLFFFSYLRAFMEADSLPISFQKQLLRHLVFSDDPIILDNFGAFQRIFPKFDKDTVIEYIDSHVNLPFSALLLLLDHFHVKRPLLNFLDDATMKKQCMPVTVLVSKAFELHEGEFDPTKLVNLLNCEQLQDEQRVLVWKAIVNVPYEEFSRIFKYRGDEVNFVKYALKFGEQARSAIAEASLRSIEAFDLAYDLIKDDIKSHSGEILMKDFKQCYPKVIEFLNYIKPVPETMVPMHNMMRAYMAVVKADLHEGNINPAHITPLFGWLEVTKSFQIGTNSIVEEMGQLKYAAENASVQSDDTQKLALLLRQSILI